MEDRDTKAVNEMLGHSLEAGIQSSLVLACAASNVMSPFSAGVKICD